jgi:hypothetical protein
MSNMSYCRFENTHSDLLDCYDALIEMDDIHNASEEMSDYEREAMFDLIKLCQNIAYEFGGNV